MKIAMVRAWVDITQCRVQPSGPWPEDYEVLESIDGRVLTAGFIDRETLARFLEW